MKTYLTFSCAFLLLLLNSTMQAQTADASNTLSEEDLKAVLFLHFEIAAPNDAFTQMKGGTGWIHKATNSKLVCSALPASYDRVRKDFEAEAEGSYSGMKTISNETLELDGIPGFLFMAEHAPSATEKNQEPFYHLSYVRYWDKGVSVMVTAAYPKSMHDSLGPEIRAVFPTLRLKKE